MSLYRFEEGVTEKFRLHRGDLVRLPASSAIYEIRGLVGRIWVTGDDEGHDFILSEGQRLELPGRDLVLIEALTDAEAMVLRAKPRSRTRLDAALVR